MAREFLTPPGALTAQDISLPSLFLNSLLQIPSVAQVIMLLALAAGGLAVMGSRTADVARRLLGAVALVLVALVLIRLHRFFGNYPDWSPIGSLRLGVYLAAAGGVLTVIGREASARRRTGVPGPALAGVALILVSAVVAWAVQPFSPPGSPIPMEAGAISVFFLFSRTLVRFPTVAQVIIPAGVVAGALLLWPTTSG